MKLQDKNIVEILQDTGMDKCFLNETPKAKETKVKTDKTILNSSNKGNSQE